MHWAARQAVVRISLMCVSQLEASSLPSHRSMLWVCSLHASTSLIKLSWRTWYLLKTRKRKLQKEKRADKTEWQRKQTQICPQYVQWQDSSEHLHGCAATWRLRIEKDFQLHCKDASVSCEKNIPAQQRRPSSHAGLPGGQRPGHCVLGLPDPRMLGNWHLDIIAAECSRSYI